MVRYEGQLSYSCDKIQSNNIKMKVKNDHRSKFSNLRNWKEEA